MLFQIVQMRSHSFEKALAIYPRNITAMYRMGYLYMGEGDFQSANIYLSEAFNYSPGHRGLRKLLGYDYAWLNKPDKAYIMLSEIPEAAEELDYYQWWWERQGRDDLASNAKVVRALLINK